MVDINSIEQTRETPAQPDDVVTEGWVNDVAVNFGNQGDIIAQLANRLASVEEAVIPFRSTPLSGLNLAYNGGRVKMIDGSVLTILPGTIRVPDNRTTYFYINIDGVPTLAFVGQRPDVGYEIAQVIAEGGRITAVNHYPLAQIGYVLPDFEKDFATIEYANSRAWQSALTATKTRSFSIPGTGSYYTIPFESFNVGDGFGDSFTENTTFKAGQNGSFIFHLRMRVYSDSVFSNNLSAKISVYRNNFEYVIAHGVTRG